MSGSAACTYTLTGIYFQGVDIALKSIWQSLVIHLRSLSLFYIFVEYVKVDRLHAGFPALAESAEDNCVNASVWTNSNVFT